MALENVRSASQLTRHVFINTGKTPPHVWHGQKFQCFDVPFVWHGDGDQAPPYSLGGSARRLNHPGGTRGDFESHFVRICPLSRPSRFPTSATRKPRSSAPSAGDKPSLWRGRLRAPGYKPRHRCGRHRLPPALSHPGHEGEGWPHGKPPRLPTRQSWQGLLPSGTPGGRTRSATV